MIEVVLNPIIDGVTYVLGSFVSNIGSRLAQCFIPSQFDKATWTNVELRRQELALREEHFRIQMEEARDSRLHRLREIEMQSKMHRDTQMELRDRDETLKRWPLAVSPIDIFEASQARGGRSLNVILLIIDTHDDTFYSSEKGKSVSDTMRLLGDGPLDFTKSTASRFGEDILLYSEPPGKNSRLTGTALRSKLWNPLWTEPTVLIEINVRSATHLKLHVSYWGSAFEAASEAISPKEGAISFKPVDVDFSVLPVDNSATRERAMALVMSGMLVALADAFRALHNPHTLSSPVFPSLMAELPPISPLYQAIWQPLVKPYISTYDQVAVHSPIVASELAAKAANAAHHAGQADFAGRLLDKAWEVHPLSNTPTPSVSVINSVLSRHRSVSKSSSALENAMIALRDWVPIRINHDDIRDRMRE